jgi:hypothetical protein
VSGNRARQHEAVAREITKLEAELKAVEAEIKAERHRASPGTMQWTPDALDQLLGLYDRMLPEEDQQERIKMREELIELLAIKFIDRLVLLNEGLRVWVYFKPRKNGRQLVLIISIASRNDDEGRVEQWGWLDPTTGKVEREASLDLALADIHLAMTGADKEGFVWNDRWLR